MYNQDPGVCGEPAQAQAGGVRHVGPRTDKTGEGRRRLALLTRGGDLGVSPRYQRRGVAFSCNPPAPLRVKLWEVETF